MSCLADTLTYDMEWAVNATHMMGLVVMFLWGLLIACSALTCVSNWCHRSRCGLPPLRIGLHVRR